MKPMKNLIYLSMLWLCSCGATKVVVNTINDSVLELDRMNLTSVMIGPVWQPVFPLIDASAFNAKTNKIVDEIMDEEEKLIDIYKSILIENLEKNIDAEIITTKDMNPDIIAKYQVTKGVQVDNKNFPIVFFSEGDINFLDLGKGKNVKLMFKTTEEIRSRVTQVAKELKLSNILVSYSRIAVIGAGMFGVNATVRLETYLFMYNQTGLIVMDAYGWSKPVTIKGKELVDYKEQLDNFNELATLMGQELSNHVK